MRTIQLTKGYETIVDDEDYDFLMRWKWYALSTPLIYASRQVRLGDGKYRRFYMHLILCKAPAGIRSDHKNGDTLDNRKDNLRFATPLENARNRGPLKGKTSLHKGVCWHKKANKWQASIRVLGKTNYLGLFLDEREAAAVYEEAARVLFGEFHRPSKDITA